MTRFDGDREALEVLGLLSSKPQLVDTANGRKWQTIGERFTGTSGVISKTDPAYKPTDKEFDAIDYLCDEWDYGWNG